MLADEIDRLSQMTEERSKALFKEELLSKQASLLAHCMDHLDAYLG